MNPSLLSEWHWRQIAEHSGEVSWLIDCSSGKLAYVSPAADQLGYDSGGLALLAAELVAALPQRRQLLAAGDPAQRRLVREFEQPHRDGSLIPIEVVSTLIEADAGQPAVLVGMVRDISARRAQQLAQKKFASMVSHEFRTPLATIDGAIQRLESTAEASGADEATRKRYRKIQVAVDRILAMLDEYMSPERLASIGRERQANQVVPATLLENAAARARSPQHAITVETAGLPDSLRGDPNGMQLCLQIMLDNATKYTPDGTAIVVTGRPAAEGGLEFLVSDGGPGLADDEIPFLFDKSMRGRNAAGIAGSGLGLYMARAMIEQHGGILSAANGPGGGAVFRIWLPLHADSGKSLASGEGNSDNRPRQA